MQIFDDAGVIPGPGYRGDTREIRDTLCMVKFQGFVVYKDMAPNFEREHLGHRRWRLHCRNYEDMASVLVNPNVPIVPVRIQVKCPRKPQKQTHTHTHTHTYLFLWYRRSHRCGGGI